MISKIVRITLSNYNYAQKLSRYSNNPAIFYLSTIKNKNSNKNKTSKFVSNPLKVYKNIKDKQQSHENNQLLSLQEQLAKNSVKNQFNTQISTVGKDNNKSIDHINNANLMNVRCQGCNVYLQATDNTKYGYIDKKILKQSIQINTKNIHKIYDQKVQSRDTKILDFMHEVQKQSGIKIFDQSTQQLQNLDNLQIMMRIQQKIDRYQQNQQLTHRSKKNRKDILCFRCFSLKYHNRLPQQYDNNQGFTTDSTQFILNKIFNRHKNNAKIGAHYFLVVDVLDILGTMHQSLIHRMLAENITFSVIVNKIDIVNQKYLNEQSIHTAVRKRLNQHIQSYNQRNGIRDSNQAKDSIKIFYLSTKSRDGFKTLEKFITEVKGSIQLVGLPNTGKTTIINALARVFKSISKIPGTTIKITEQEYGRGKNRKLYDMPGLYYPHLLYNLITKPSIKSLLTWDKKIAPGILTHSAIFYGGKVQIQGVRIIVFGLGGVCSGTNRWFVSHLPQFWKGLPSPSNLKIQKYEHELQFTDGVTGDLQIAGYGFIGFRLCIPNIKKTNKTLKLYLPEGISYNLRMNSILINDAKTFHNKSAITKKHMLQRLYLKPREQRKKLIKQKQQKLKQKKNKFKQNKYIKNNDRQEQQQNIADLSLNGEINQQLISNLREKQDNVTNLFDESEQYVSIDDENDQFQSK